MGSKTINWAIVGYGGMGGWHEKNVTEKVTGINLVGIYDIRECQKEKARSKGIHVFDSLEEILNDESIDLVTVATPNDLHKEIAVKLMDAGKNVISEKPVTLCSEDLEEMIAAAERNNVLFTVHQNRRWDSDYLTAKNIFDKNILGNVFEIESRVHGSRGIPGDWRNTKAQGGGMVLDWGVHLLDQILMMMNGSKVVSVYADLTNVTNEEVDDGFCAIVKFNNGVRTLIEVGTSNFINLPRWYMLGENGSAQITDWNMNGEIVMVSDWENKDAVPIVAGAGLTKTMAPRDDDSIKKYPLEKVEGVWTEFYENIVAALNGEATQLITHDQLRRSMKLMEAIFESGETGKTIFPNI